MPKRIEHKINAFASRELCRGDEIGIAGHQNDLIDLALVAQGCNVQADTHINTLLGCGIFEICVGQDGKTEIASKQLLQFAFLQLPFPIIHQMPKTECNFAQFAQLVVQRQPKSRLRSSRKVN
jgi:hypothetical protein